MFEDFRTLVVYVLKALPGRIALDHCINFVLCLLTKGDMHRISITKQVMHIVRRLRNELKVNTTCGASNVSFGLPNRNGINSAFLTMAIGAGMTSAITSPLHSETMQAVLGADVMMGNDPDCRAWIKKYREPTADGEGRGGRTRRRRSA